MIVQGEGGGRVMVRVPVLNVRYQDPFNPSRLITLGHRPVISFKDDEPGRRRHAYWRAWVNEKGRKNQ